MPDAAPGARRIFIATPGFEDALVAELPPGFVPDPCPGAGATVTDTSMGIVETSEPAGGANGPATPPIDPIFARQQLPHAAQIRGTSVAALAEAAYARIEAAVDGVAGPFTLHAFTPTGAAPALGSRAALVAAETLGRLRDRRRRAVRWYREPASVTAAFGEVQLVVQILMTDRDRAWVSAARPETLSGGGAWTIAPWPGGVAPVADDRRPPSRAYRKLEEAFQWMNAAPRENDWCVDLGGAPGGWAYVALARGARVIAVDRAPLDRSLLRHPHLTMIEGNAFTYEPPAARASAGTGVDWLLSDVICEPARAANLIDVWLGRGWCRRLVVTVKFKGRAGYGMLSDVRATLDRHGCSFARIKHLHNNKNEVTVMAVAAVAPVVAPVAAVATVAPPRTRDPR